MTRRSLPRPAGAAQASTGSGKSSDPKPLSFLATDGITHLSAATEASIIRSESRDHADGDAHLRVTCVVVAEATASATHSQEKAEQRLERNVAGPCGTASARASAAAGSHQSIRSHPNGGKHT